MTRSELLAFAPSLFSCPTHCGALTYAVPTTKWLRGPFWDFFHGRLWNANLDKWAVRWECRDFARAYAAMALECWALTQGGTGDDGLAVGEMWFIPAGKTNVGHAVCPAITDDGLIFIDPQTNQLWPYSPEEFSSRYFLRF